MWKGRRTAPRVFLPLSTSYYTAVTTGLFAFAFRFARPIASSTLIRGLPTSTSGNQRGRVSDREWRSIQRKCLRPLSNQSFSSTMPNVRAVRKNVKKQLSLRLCHIGLHDGKFVRVYYAASKYLHVAQR